LKKEIINTIVVIMSKKINKFIKILISTDFILSSSWGLISPIFAIFLIEGIIDNPIEAAKVAGFSSLIYWVLKSILQIPISNYLDKNHGEVDDFYFLMTGVCLTSFVPFGFAFSSLVWHIYTLEALHAIGMAMVIPSRSAMFTRHIDKGQEAYEWAINSTCLGIGAGITGAVGGVIASVYSFRIVFILTGIFSFLSAFAVFLIKNEVKSTNEKVARVSKYIE